MSEAVWRYAQIARRMDLANISTSDEKCCRALMDGLSELYQELEIPSPESYGIDKASYDEHIEKMANDAVSASAQPTIRLFQLSTKSKISIIRSIMINVTASNAHRL